MARSHAGTVADSLDASGFAVRSQIIWDKTRLVIGRGDYHWQHEPAWYAVRKGKKGHWAGDRKQTTVWAIPHRKSESGHGTEKPVECMRRPIENNSSPGQAVYEPFSGSGTTIIAAEMTGRACHAIELNPAYVDVAVTRWQAFTGEDARLEGDGRSFAEVRQATSWRPRSADRDRLMTTKAAILQAIRQKCLDCSCHQASEVRECPVSRCGLWPFRLGSDPQPSRNRGFAGSPVYTGTSRACAATGTQALGRRSASETGPLQAGFLETGAMIVDRQD